MKIDEQPTTPIDWDKSIETTEGYPARVISEDFRDDGEILMLVQIEHPNRSIARTFKKNGSPYWSYDGKMTTHPSSRLVLRLRIFPG